MEIPDINLNEIEEKPLLPADREMHFAVIKCECRVGKKPNDKTGKNEPYFACQLAPMDPEFAGQDYKVYHNWHITLAALQHSDPAISLRKTYKILNFQPVGGIPRTEDVQNLQFIGKLKYDDKNPNFPQLASVLRGVN